MTKAGEREIVRVEQANGGAGYLLKEALLNQEEMGEHCRMFSKVVIPPGSELGCHTHVGETETYYMLSGQGIYTDNGRELTAEAGDVFFCKDGDSHGLRNTGTEDIAFVAMILKK